LAKTKRSKTGINSITWVHILIPPVSHFARHGYAVDIKADAGIIIIIIIIMRKH